MKFKRLAKLLLALLLVTSPFCYADLPEPMNLSLLKQQIMQYYSSGEYFQQISEKIRQALYYLRFRIYQNKRLSHPNKLAIVLDIDETSLSNYPDLQSLNFGGSLKEMNRRQMVAHDPAIRSTRMLYRYAKSHDIAVFFVTGRTESMRKPTVKNLIAAGYNNWDGLFMKPNSYHRSTVVPYKTAMRKKIIQMGYDIVLNIGDQKSDLAGGYADMSFKLPDPFYYIA